jgi:hypothetical protein
MTASQSIHAIGVPSLMQAARLGATPPGPLAVADIQLAEPAQLPAHVVQVEQGPIGTAGHYRLTDELNEDCLVPATGRSVVTQAPEPHGGGGLALPG